MVNKTEQTKPTPDANAPQTIAPSIDDQNFVTQTSRHPLGHLITGKEKPTGDAESEK